MRLSTSVVFQGLEGRVTTLEANVANGFTANGIAGALGFIPANRMGDSFAGQVSAVSFVAETVTADIFYSPPSGTAGAIRLSRSFAAGFTGIIEILKSDNSRNGFVGFNPDAGAMQYGSDTGAGHNFTGGPIMLGDANIGIKQVGSDPVFMCDAGDYFYYSRSANKYYFVIGGVNVASIDASGNMRLKGTLTQSVTP